MSQWLYDGLREAGYDTVLLETRYVRAALSAMAVKTDRRDARGIAQLLRMGWFRPLHRKSVPSRPRAGPVWRRRGGPNAPGPETTPPAEGGRHRRPGRLPDGRPSTGPARCTQGGERSPLRRGCACDASAGGRIMGLVTPDLLEAEHMHPGPAVRVSPVHRPAGAPARTWVHGRCHGLPGGAP